MSETRTEPPIVGEIISGNRKVTKVEPIDMMDLIKMAISGKNPEDAEHLTVCIIPSTPDTAHLVWYENINTESHE